VGGGIVHWKGTVKERLDKWLKRRFSGLSERHVEESLAAGLVHARPGAKRLRKGLRAWVEAEIEVAPLQAHLARLRQGNPDMIVPVVGEGDGFVVVHKPPGMPSHPISLMDFGTITHWAFHQYPESRAEFTSMQPTMAPHRLDTGTEGLLVVALRLAAYEEWRRRFHGKEVTKRYLAWCWGAPGKDRFDVAVPLAHDPADRRKMVAAGVDGALPAESSVTVERRLADAFLAGVTCRTGVTHQVRVHLATAGHPLVGDELYDARWGERRVRPPYHWLLASSLAWGPEKWEVDALEFTSRMG